MTVVGGRTTSLRLSCRAAEAIVETLLKSYDGRATSYDVCRKTWPISSRRKVSRITNYQLTTKDIIIELVFYYGI